jgi:hypothetical protein
LNGSDEQVKAILEHLTQAGKITGFAYDHFRQSEAVPPPFAVYRRVAPYQFKADDVVYYQCTQVDMELYAETPEEMAALMQAAEAALDEQELCYAKTADTVYIESEDFYETLYEL